MCGARAMDQVMNKLTPEQQAALQQWAGEGATLNDIQRRLKDEFGVNITYLDARLLLLDLQVKLKDKPKEPAPVPAAEPELESEQGAADDVMGDTVVDEATGAPVAGAMSVGVDQIAIPGAIISGRVTFSDGQNARWYLDQMGRLGLSGAEPGYKPPAADVPLFQQELDRILMQAGF